MNLRLITFILLGLLCSSAFPQNVVFERTSSAQGTIDCKNDYPNDVISCRDQQGNFYISGRAAGRILTEKFTPAGKLSWRHFFQSPPLWDSAPKFIGVDEGSGNIIVAGQSRDFSFATGILAFSITSGGSTYWSYTEGTMPDILGLSLDSQGNACIASGQDFFPGWYLTKLSAVSGSPVYRVQEGNGSGSTFKILTGGQQSLLYVLEGLGNSEETVSGQVFQTYNVTRFDTETGHPIWQRSITGNSIHPKIAPFFLTLAPGGDVFVTGEGGLDAQDLTCGTIDRLDAASGHFLFRESLEPSNGAAQLLFKMDADNYDPSPVADTAGNLYWSATVNYHGLRFGMVGRNGPDGTPIWKSAFLPNNSYEAVAMPQGVMYEDYNGHCDMFDKDGRWQWTGYSGIYGDRRFLSVHGQTPSIAGGKRDEFGNEFFTMLSLDSVNGSILISSEDHPLGPISTNYSDLVTDKSGNSYTCGNVGQFLTVTKFSSGGTVLWEQTIGDGTAAWAGIGLRIVWSPNGNLAVSGRAKGGLVLAKMDDRSGSILWQIEDRTLWVDGDSRIAFDGLDNVLVAASASEPFGTAITEYAASTGASLWRYTRTNSQPNGGTISLGIDSVNNAYFGYDSWEAHGFILCKLSASGSLQYSVVSRWPSEGLTRYPAMTIDPNGRAFVAYASMVHGAPSLSLARYDASGNYLGTSWRPNFQLYFYGLDIRYNPLNEHIYVGTLASGNSYSGEPVLYCFDRGGAFLWQNVLKADPGTDLISLERFGFDSFGSVFSINKHYLDAGHHPSADTIITRIDSHGVATASYTYEGEYASVADSFPSIAVGPDGAPIIAGQGPSEYGPGLMQALIVKIAFPNLELKSLVVYPSTVVGGNQVFGKVTLSLPSPPGGTSIAISDDSNSITTPPSVRVPAGSTYVSFPIQTSAVGAPATRIVTATLDGVSKSANLTLTPVRVDSLTINPSTVKGGMTTTGTVGLDGPAPAGGLTVMLSDNSSSITEPYTMFIPKGQVRGDFVIHTSAVGQVYVRSVFATYSGVTKTAAITLTP